MRDDLDWILETYGSVPEYYRSQTEETYDEYIRSEKLNALEEAIEKADDTHRHWAKVPVWEDKDFIPEHLMTDKEKLEAEYKEYLTGTIDDMNEWRDADEEIRKMFDPEADPPGKSKRSRKTHRR